MKYDHQSPPPGSDAADELGCTCPVMDNAHGRGRGGDGARFGWYIAGNCPVHAQPKNAEAEGE